MTQNDRFQFRIWDAYTNTMEYPSMTKAAENYDHPFPQQMEMMQCTGLKDKTGRFIYEGDIIRLKFGKQVWIGEVTWDKYMGLKFSAGGWTSLVHVETVGNIIGNKFENPELLKTLSMSIHETEE